MPITSATRDVLQGHMGQAANKPNGDEILANDFAQMAETMAESGRYEAGQREQGREDRPWKL